MINNDNILETVNNVEFFYGNIKDKGKGGCSCVITCDSSILYGLKDSCLSKSSYCLLTYNSRSAMSVTSNC